jgi:hypothetical protein
MKTNECFGSTGLVLLVMSICQTNMSNLRIFSILASSAYLVQSLMLKNKSLTATNLILIGINLVKLFGIF